MKAAYARYSADKQTENKMEAVSKYCLDHQSDLCTAFLMKGHIGTNTNREGFQALVAGAKRHEFDTAERTIAYSL